MTNLAQLALRLMGVTDNDRFPNDDTLPIPTSAEGWEKGWTIIVNVLRQHFRDEPQTTWLQSELTRCDRAFNDGNWPMFRQAVESIRTTVQEGHQ